MVVPNPSEVCRLEIDGVQYTTFETIMVQHRWMELFPIFEVSVSEPTPGPTSFTSFYNLVWALKVLVFLADVLAITGIITVRQSAADSNRHGVQFIVKGQSWQTVKSSIAPPLGNFDNQSYQQIAVAICKQSNVGVVVAPNTTVDSSPFQVCQAAPGEPAFDFLEKHAREKRIILGSDEYGHVVLIGQGQPPPLPDVFQEGGPNRNIERINVVISNDTLFAHYFAVAQNFANNQLWGTNAAQIALQMGGTDPLASSLVIPVELAMSDAEVAKRLVFEHQIHEGTFITATITVPGWLRSNGDIWRVGQTYTVIAPDHFPGFPNGIFLAAKTVTFEQSEGAGTTTTLELVRPEQLNGNLLQPGLPSPATPGDATPAD